MGNNGRKVVETRLPAERRPDPLACRDDLSGIACPPRRLLDLEIDSRDALDRFDDFQHRETVAVAAIERQSMDRRIASGAMNPSAHERDR